MFTADFQTPPALQRFELTYSPAHKPNGTPLDPRASRQVLQERRTAETSALNADGAVRAFERDHDRMVTDCKRVQESAL